MGPIILGAEERPVRFAAQGQGIRGAAVRGTRGAGNLGEGAIGK